MLKLQDLAAKKNTANQMSPLIRKKRNAPIPTFLSHCLFLSFFCMKDLYVICNFDLIISKLFNFIGS
ncbi:hypothetical protein SF1_16400 [Sphingobacterium faecium NBRC 15299]|jgi:hypothetical protein|nr:hypothetical protein C8N37_106360 [Sphingobacterium faecium]GEM63658.1 hypothetical protein SF1_16400 [Sphingobacterium faecium NBRC 15299]